MILLINICKEKLHFYEFVKPVGDVLIKEGKKGFIRHYTCLTKKDLEKADKIIICGTSVFDDDFLRDVDKFNWIKNYKKPILGICGGMHIIGLVFGGKLAKNIEESKNLLRKKTEESKNLLRKKTEESKNLLRKKIEIGYFKEDFNREFLGLKDSQEVYHLHNNYVDFSNLEFDVYAGNKVSQAVKYKKRQIYGVLFHPEVRQKDLIKMFCLL